MHLTRLNTARPKGSSSRMHNLLQLKKTIPNFPGIPAKTPAVSRARLNDTKKPAGREHTGWLALQVRFARYK